MPEIWQGFKLPAKDNVGHVWDLEVELIAWPFNLDAIWGLIASNAKLEIGKH